MLCYPHGTGPATHPLQDAGPARHADRASSLSRGPVQRSSHPETPLEAARALEEARDALRSYETSALAGVAATLAGAAESLAKTARELHEMRREEWMTSEQAADYLGKTKRGFERIAPHLPRRYVSRQDILYPHSLIDEALYAAASVEEAIVGNPSECRHDDKSRGAAGGSKGTGAAASLRKVMNKS